MCEMAAENVMCPCFSANVRGQVEGLVSGAVNYGAGQEKRVMWHSVSDGTTVRLAAAHLHEKGKQGIGHYQGARHSLMPVAGRGKHVGCAGA